VIRIAITKAHETAASAGDVETRIHLSKEQHDRILKIAQGVLDLFTDDEYDVGRVVITAWPREED